MSTSPSREIIASLFDDLKKLAQFFQLRRRKLSSGAAVKLKELEGGIDQLVEDKRKLHTEAEAKQKELESAIDQLVEDKGKLHTEAEAKQKELESEIGKLVKDKKQLEETPNLISRILSGQPEENPHLNAFKLFWGDFLKFANAEESLANEAEMIITMQAVRDQLERVAHFPVIHGKRVIAIGGGFSSGKSTFLNHIFEFAKEEELPVDINPATAIPTYVLPGSGNIEGINHRGAKFDLSDCYTELSHNFIKSFPFLREMLPAIMIQPPLRRKTFDHICFLDTPGYNFSDKSLPQTDEKVAAEQLHNADAIIWMIGLDANGTITSPDLKFLKGIDNKDLYIILSKAELRVPKEIEDILQKVVDCLDDYDIKYYGINAYSAKNGQEYSHRKQPLSEFFTETNKQVKTKTNLQTKINKVFEAYDSALKNDLEKAQKFHSTINSFKLDMLENSASDDLYDQFSERVGGLEYPRNEEKLKGDIKMLGKLQSDMNNILEEFFKKFVEDIF